MKNEKKFKIICHDTNIKLSKSKLTFQTFGNVSQRLDQDHFIIKPSGVDVARLNWQKYPVIRIIDNKIVNGKLNPSSDTPTHSEIYKMSKDIGGITHAHSKYVTIWAQSKKKIPILGTTHADYWDTDIPITKKITNNHIKKDYEKNIGKYIRDVFNGRNKIKNCPGVLVVNHGGFCWGKDAVHSFLNFEILEFVAETAFKTLQINKNSKIEKHLIKKHFSRKHGKVSYYGQKKK